MPSPSTYHHDNLRESLIVAALGLAQVDGAAGVTIAKVAAACGVSVAAPYRHFANKEQLMGAVAGVGFRELSAAMAAQVATAESAADRLVAAGVGYVEFAVENPHLFSLMFTVDARDRDAAARETLSGLEKLIADVDVGVEPEVAVRVSWALAHGLAMLRIGGMLTFTTDDTADGLRAELSTILAGIITRPDIIRVTGAIAPLTAGVDRSAGSPEVKQSIDCAQSHSP